MIMELIVENLQLTVEVLVMLGFSMIQWLIVKKIKVEINDIYFENYLIINCLRCW